MTLALAGPFDTNDVSAEVGEQYPSERARVDSGQLDDSDAVQRPHHWCSSDWGFTVPIATVPRHDLLWNPSLLEREHVTVSGS
jgi:hypothetical protein